MNITRVYKKKWERDELRKWHIDSRRIYSVLVGKCERGHLEDVGLDGKISEWNLKNYKTGGGMG